MATRHRSPRRAPAVAAHRSYAAVSAPEGAPLPSLKFCWIDPDAELRIQVSRGAVLHSSVDVVEAVSRLKAVRAVRTSSGRRA